MQDVVRIPEERIAILIGKSGKVRNAIEKLTETKILVLDNVVIEGDSLNVMKAKDIVRAIGRGFNPEIAMLLSDEDYELYIININQKEKALRRTVARIIGTKGKTRKIIEYLTGAHISVLGKTVGIIGTNDQVVRAENSIELIIKGKSHSFVYGRMKKNRKFVLENPVL